MNTLFGAAYWTSQKVREGGGKGNTAFWVYTDGTTLIASHGALPNVYHFDSKAEVEDYIRSIGIPATYFLAGCYMSNFPGRFLRETSPGKWTIALPIPDSTRIPLIDIKNDTGKFVKAIFKKKDATLGKRIYGATAYYTPHSMLEQLKEVYPGVKEVSFSELPSDVFKGMLGSGGAPEALQEEMLEMFEFFAGPEPGLGYYGGDSLDSSTAVRSLIGNFWPLPF